MIGTSIRSIRHLYRVSDTSLKTILIKFGENTWEICKSLKTTSDSPFGETLFIFNNITKHCHWSMDTVLNSKDVKNLLKGEDITYDYGRVISISQNEFMGHQDLFHEITMLPNSFNKDYENFLQENGKALNPLINGFGLNTKDIRVKRLYIYTNGSKNFFQWALNAYFKNGVSLSTIKNILLWNESYKQLAKNLSKGTITAYTSRESINALLMELSELRTEKRINDSINSFNTQQKKLLKENELSNDIKQALCRLSRLSDTKRLNFIKKMSSVSDFNELSRQLKFVTSVHFSWNKESFMDFIENVEGVKYEKIFENDSVVLVKVLDYETIKQLGKTTNWCISKNKQYWNNYIENYHGLTTQYVVFDFSKVEDDKLSIIGFTTTHNKGITSAHNFINEDLMSGNQNEQVLLNSFIENFKDNKNIYSILSEDGIDITMIVEYDALPYRWDKEALLKYLYECVGKENVETLMSNNEKIVLSVVDENIRYFFGDAYHDNISSDYYKYQHIIFIDFNRNKYDINKIQFAIIESGYDEDYCIMVCNERSLNNGKNFDSLLIEYNLPYNTIRRTNNPIVRLRNGIVSFNSLMVKDVMKECSRNQLKSVIEKEIGPDTFYEVINRSILTYMSFDFLDLVYKNNIQLHDVMPLEYICDLINNFSQGMSNINRHTENFSNMEGITDEEIKDFYNKNIRRREDVKYIGYYLAIKMIIENEKLEPKEYNTLLRKFFNSLSRINTQVEVYEQIINLAKDKIHYNSDVDSIHYIAKYALLYGSDGLKEFMEEKSKTNPRFKARLDNIKSTKDAKTNGYSYSIANTRWFDMTITNDNPF